MVGKFRNQLINLIKKNLFNFDKIEKKLKDTPLHYEKTILYSIKGDKSLSLNTLLLNLKGKNFFIKN